MLEHLPASIGRLLRSFRPHQEDLIFHDPSAEAPETLTITSAALTGAPLPVEFTEDGARLSPPLAWSGVPDEAEAVLVVVEDADSPTPKPLVHAVVLDRNGGDGALEAGQISGHAEPPDGVEIGRNSFLSRSYLPPDPPPGHGPHRYVFQVFALSEAPKSGRIEGRTAALKAMKYGVLAKGLRIGTYERA